MTDHSGDYLSATIRARKEAEADLWGVSFEELIIAYCDVRYRQEVHGPIMQYWAADLVGKR
jgi:hypothetical protein